VGKVIDAIESPSIMQLNQLARVDGIGIKTLEKVFKFANTSSFENNLKIYHLNNHHCLILPNLRKHLT
jgi:hypothetical protein